MDKGTASNLVSACLLATGIACPAGPVQALILSAGLFAISGGVTNSLAVKMLFDRIPGLVGSGVIPARFREIRLQIKALIMEHFFSEEHLRRFLEVRRGAIDWARYVRWPESGPGPARAFVEEQWDEFASPESVQPLISAQVDRLMESSFGGFLLMVGKKTIEDEISKFVYSFLDSMKERVFAASDSFRLDASSLRIDIDEDAVVRDLRVEVDGLLEKKLEQLDAQQVKRMMEDVIRNHLGWLVVWGNVFGGVLGVAAHFGRLL